MTDHQTPAHRRLAHELASLVTREELVARCNRARQRVDQKVKDFGLGVKVGAMRYYWEEEAQFLVNWFRQFDHLSEARKSAKEQQ